MPQFEGKNIASAIDTGILTMGVTREQVQVRVIQEGKAGFFGLGAHPAIVELTRVDPVTPAPTAALVHTAAVESAARTDDAPASTSHRDEQELVMNEAAATATEAPVSKHAAANQAAVNVISAMLQAVGTDMGRQVTVQSTKVHGGVVFHLSSDHEAALIGRHGRTINSLQFLAQTVYDRQSRGKWIITLDVGDYRERRRATLQRLAARTALEVVSTGRPVYLDPMPAFERKVIHQALGDNPHVDTRSEGRGDERSVIVSPRR